MLLYFLFLLYLSFAMLFLMTYFRLCYHDHTNVKLKMNLSFQIQTSKNANAISIKSNE